MSISPRPIDRDRDGAANPILRPARARDVVRFSKYVLPRFVGVVAELEGAFIGAGVVIWGDGNRPFLCLEITDELRKRPKFLHRTTLDLINAVAPNVDFLYTMESAKEPTANRWLRRLGFQDTGETLNGERVMSWRKSS